MPTVLITFHLFVFYSGLISQGYHCPGSYKLHFHSNIRVHFHDFIATERNYDVLLLALSLKHTLSYQDYIFSR